MQARSAPGFHVGALVGRHPIEHMRAGELRGPRQYPGEYADPRAWSNSSENTMTLPRDLSWGPGGVVLQRFVSQTGGPLMARSQHLGRASA